MCKILKRETQSQICTISSGNYFVSGIILKALQHNHLTVIKNDGKFKTLLEVMAVVV